MNKDVIRLSVFLVVTVSIVSIALLLPYENENKIYASILKTIGTGADLKKVAFLNLATDCYLSEQHKKIRITHMKGILPETWEAFFEANREITTPVRLTELEGKYNIVSWRDSKQISGTKGLSLNFRPSEKRIIKLSRVGFGSSGKQALLCIEAPDVGFIYLVENKSDEWKVINSWKAWGH